MAGMSLRRRRNLSQWLAIAPWWISVLIASSAFVLLQYVLPPLLDDTDVEASGALLKFLSPYIAILLIIPLPFALFHRDAHERLIEAERNLDLLRDLSHMEFVSRLVPVFKQDGYGVEIIHDSRLIDLILRRGGEKTIVVCKEWDASTVSARFVAQVRDIQLANNAAGAKVITCGAFRPAALRFQRTSSVELIDGAGLLKLIDRFKRAQQRAIDEPDADLAGLDPLDRMAMRAARRHAAPQSLSTVSHQGGQA